MKMEISNHTLSYIRYSLYAFLYSICKLLNGDWFYGKLSKLYMEDIISIS